MAMPTNEDLLRIKEKEHKKLCALWKEIKPLRDQLEPLERAWRTASWRYHEADHELALRDGRKQVVKATYTGQPKPKKVKVLDQATINALIKQVEALMMND